MFTLQEKHLRKLCEINHFPYSEDEVYLFGLRECLPVHDDNHSFFSSHLMKLSTGNYVHPRCTIMIWKPGQSFATFPGSTLPSQRNIRKAKTQRGQGANRLVPGRITGYYKGMHASRRTTGHKALRNDRVLPVRRTVDNLIYNNLDDVDTKATKAQHDNIHCAWAAGLDNHYDSAGCQVILGYPKCKKRGERDNVGPWKSFVETIYDMDQDRFVYFLLLGRDAQKVVLQEGRPLSARLRYGSQGDLVKTLQTRLQEERFYSGAIDGDFGMKTLDSVLKFQTNAFGPEADDGVIGPQTAAALRMDWPSF